MKNKISAEVIIYIIAICLVVLIWVFVYHSDKRRCERNGGLYIWEYSEGSKCHLKGEK